MIARVARFQVSIDVIDEVIKTFREGVIPAVELQEGYRNGYLLTDRKTGEGISVTLWTSKEDGIASEETGYYQEQMIKFEGLSAAPPTFDEYYEVSVQA